MARALRAWAITRGKKTRSITYYNSVAAELEARLLLLCVCACARVCLPSMHVVARATRCSSSNTMDSTADVTSLGPVPKFFVLYEPSHCIR